MATTFFNFRERGLGCVWRNAPLTATVTPHPGIEECPDELQQPLVLDPLGGLAHQFVVIDSIEIWS
jgi:hypothetical protein